MEISDSSGFGNAFEKLRGPTSYAKLSTQLSIITDGRINIDPATLQRFGTGRTQNTRSLDSPAMAHLFSWGMMLHALRGQSAPVEVTEQGKLLLVQLLGPDWAQHLFADIEQQANRLGCQTFRIWLEQRLRNID